MYGLRRSIHLWRIPEPREVPRVAAAFADVRWRRVFLLLTLTGLRRQELRRLRWRHVNLVEGTLRVEDSKSEEGERSIALPSSLVQHLVDHFSATSYRSDDDFVFCHPERGSMLDADAYHEAFQKALTAAGIKDRVRSFQDLPTHRTDEPRGHGSESDRGDGNGGAPKHADDEAVPPPGRCGLP
jgi:integrase